jgi:DNA polymerase III epsilon subunit-like protein
MPRNTTPMAIIDFEASCLPEDHFSYPIEVALAKVDGPSRTWLIKPPPCWQYWDWCEEAEALHGISPERLQREGLPIAQVLAELTAEVAGGTVYADSDLDAYWLETLAVAAGKPAPFPIRYLGELFQQRGLRRQDVLSALDNARAQMPIEHIARADARRLALALRQLTSRDNGGWRSGAAA